MSEIHAIAVGQLYHPDRTEWPETIDINPRQSGLEIRLFIKAPTKQEISDVRRGAHWIALYHVDDIFMIATKWGDGQWMDGSVDITLVPAKQALDVRGDYPPGTRMTVQTILVCADTGIVHAIRLTTLSPTASAFVVSVFRQQLSRGSGNQDGRLRSLLANVTTEELVKRATITERLGSSQTF
ncbi:hypothetical protein C7S18_23470 (plasmid) [Ahniella affigens]|uniref:Uncharacterized protein n=1 Tax=Ahniella affigens TaxID=2021234 RepID=A0A2P1PZI7_9GAMM|nr:hypothetical protein [Ahniella affigens]AVQ00259.1 hypothetical protein C7S18_23470 [Ahniella affigens]